MPRKEKNENAVDFSKIMNKRFMWVGNKGGNQKIVYSVQEMKELIKQKWQIKATLKGDNS